MSKNLVSWHVEKTSKQGGLVCATLKADLKCPISGCFNVFSSEKPIVYDQNYGKQRVANELSAHQACPQCGIVFTLTEADQKDLEQELEKRDLSFK